MSKTMVSFLSCFVLVLLIAAPAHPAGPGAEEQWIALTPDDAGSAPAIRVLESDSRHTLLKVSVPGFRVIERSRDEEVFQELSLPEHTTTTDIGKPALPVVRFLVAVPDRDRVTMEVRSGDETVFGGYRVFPFQEPPVDGPAGRNGFSIDEEAYRSSEPWPSTAALVSDPVIWRHLRLVEVEVIPLTYIGERRELIARSSVTVELTYEPGGTVNVIDQPTGRIAGRWERLYSQHVVNYDWIDLERGGGQDNPGTEYLIITHPNFEAEIQPLADWHHREGFETEVVTLTTTSPTTVKNAIEDRYDQGSLEYVLLVGDTNYMPTYTWSGYTSDYWYSCITGGPDVYADVALGRLGVQYAYQAENQVAKILTYEKNPPLGSWLSNISLVAHHEDAPGKYVGCKEDIREDIIEQPPFAVETFYGHLPGGTNSNVLSCIDDGCNVVNYRGHGDTMEWWQWDYNDDSWYTSHVAQLQNGDMTPIVFNIACTCHDIPSACLGEAWMNKYPGGAVASLGATEPSYTYANHDYDKELFRQFNMYGEYRVGWMSNAAATLIIGMHGSYGQANAKMYLWLGDPATEIWTSVPGSLAASHPADILTGAQDVSVTVTDGTDPVEGATVCLSKGTEVYARGTTGSDGVVTFPIEPLTGGTLYVTASMHDYLPYEGEIEVLDYVPNIGLVLTPDAAAFPRGSDMGYTVEGTNYESSPLTVDYWAEVFLPNGNPYSGNPVFGPVTVTIPAGASPNAYLSHFIPPTTPLWTFTYTGYVGVYGSHIWAEDSFDFTVTDR